MDKLGDGLDDVAQPGASGHIIPAKTPHAAQKGAERIAEALELAQGELPSERLRSRGTQPPAPSPLLLGMARRSWRRLGDLSAADLEPALLVLPVDLVAVLLEFLADALDGDESVDVELCARAAALSLKLQAAKEVSAHAPLRRPLLKLRDALRKRLGAERALFGRNLAACRIAAAFITRVRTQHSVGLGRARGSDGAGRTRAATSAANSPRRELVGPGSRFAKLRNA